MNLQLTHTGRQLTARACADTGSTNNFCGESLESRVIAKISTFPGRSYNYRDATGNPILIIGEANLFVTLPSENKKRLLHVLVTSIWDNNTILIGI